MLINALIITFSMYSIIPMPKIEWEKNNFKYSLAFLPFVGIIIGSIIFLWFFISVYFKFNNILFNSVFLIIPPFVTGGIHLDGFIDTIDALSSNKSKEEKIKILKDPHIGSFAIIKICLYFILYFALLSQINFNKKLVIIFIICLFIERIFASMSVLFLPCFKNSGLAYIFSSNSDKKNVKYFLLISLTMATILFFYLNYVLCLLVLFVSAFSFYTFYKMCMKQFGGISGDLVGYFIQKTEILYILCFVIYSILF